MDFKETFYGEADKKYMDMLQGQTAAPFKGIKVDPSDKYVEHSKAYHKRLIDEYRAFNKAVSDVNKTRDDRLKREKEDADAKQDRLNRRKFKICKTLKIIALVLPLLTMILSGCDIFMNREAYDEATGAFGWITAGWVILTVLVIISAIFAFIRAVQKDNYYAYRARMHTNRITAILSLIFFALMSIGNLAGYSYVGVAEVESLNMKIKRLPDADGIDYMLHETVLQSINVAYNNMDFWQKWMVEDRGELEDLFKEFNDYYIERVRDELSGVSVANAETNLKDVAVMYDELTKDQRKLLTDAERSHGDNLSKAYRIVAVINEINEDLIEYHDRVDSVKSDYQELSSEYKGYVYNAYMLDGFNDQYEFLTSFEYEEIDGGWRISAKENVKLSGALEIPSHYDNMPVVEVGLFSDMDELTSIVVPSTVNHISSGAFDGCDSLREITLPFVGLYANSDYADTRTLGNIFGDTNDNRTTIYSTSGNDYGYTSQAPSQGSSSRLYYYSIPKGLRKVTITEQSEIPDYAFRNCDLLQEVVYERAVTSIGQYAFGNCSNLKEFEFNRGLTSIGEGAFYGCESFESLTLPEGLQTIGHYAFDGMRDIESVIVPDSVTSIGSGAFNGWTSLTEITLPFIGGNTTDTDTPRWVVFGYIFGDGDTDGYMDSSSTIYKTRGTSGYTSQVPEGSSYYCYMIPKSLRSVTITRQTNIPDYAFRNCDLLQEVVFERTVTSIGQYAFDNCSALRTLDIDCEVTEIERYTFSNCSKLTSFKLNRGLTSIGEGAFYGCESFGSLTLPEGVQTIGHYAFEGMRDIESVIVPDSVTSIGSGAFNGWTSLVEITLPFVGKTIDTDTPRWAAFGYIFGDGDTDDSMGYSSTVYQTSDMSGFTSQVPYSTRSYYYYAIPTSLRKVTITKQTDIPDYAFSNCDLIEEIMFSSITSTGTSAFENCNALVTDLSESE